ncbi:deaminase domain-containing protein [Bacillus sp. DX1.1]|nr:MULTISPECIES: deaminase domain-containing protein [unclassified Bacillus (in: firmicutes)]MDM5154711.1 deaminase domain-containing protein [Bacillus sp. DX1.1]WJE83599.1 deaminase domain-containing protein [Bacillus sp. DX3.1]
MNVIPIGIILSVAGKAIKYGGKMVVEAVEKGGKALLDVAKKVPSKVKEGVSFLASKAKGLGNKVGDLWNKGKTKVKNVFIEADKAFKHAVKTLMEFDWIPGGRSSLVTEAAGAISGGGKQSLKDDVIQFMKETGERVFGKGTGKVYPTRQIDSVAEAHIIDRVKEVRGNLPSKYKKAGNFALAEVDVNGINKKEFYASSKIDEFKGNLEEKVPEISLKPNEPIFEASLAPGKDVKPYMRDSDTEYKILNEIALKLGDDVNTTGKITLFTELDTYASCSKVIAEFANKYKNIELEVIHNNGERLKP